MRCFSVCFLLFLCNPSVSQDFRWVNDYVRKTTDEWDGKTFQIPVIQGEVEHIQCRVRTQSLDTYKLSILDDYFHAETTNTTTVGTAPDEYAVVNITVNIDNPDNIDDKEIECQKENKDAIFLVTRAFVRDPSLPCDPCNGTEYDKSTAIKLRRPGNQSTHQDVQESLFEKLKITQNYTAMFILDLMGLCVAVKRKNTWIQHLFQPFSSSLSLSFT